MNAPNNTQINSELTVQAVNIEEVASGNTRFVIPYYQRPYAWGAVEVRQLLDDIYASMLTFRDKEYYVGNIVCSSSEGSSDSALKVIDGQQRLTTLFLIQATLEKIIKPAKSPLLINEKTSRLTYLAREEDNKELLGYITNERTTFTHSGFETARQVIEAFVRETFSDTSKPPEEFYTYLTKQLRFVLIVLPLNIDYVEYFEVINTHVKQLEKHEVLKALLLSKIDDAKERRQCAAIWDACSQMDRWIDHERKKEDKLAIYAFKDLNDQRKMNDVLDLFSQSVSDLDEKVTLDDLLSNTEQQNGKVTDKSVLSDEPRIGSIINFATFLLLVYALETGQEQTGLDDRKLLEIMWDESFKDKRRCAATFIKRLLYWRIVFDHYIIKNIRENSDKTRWLIRPLVRKENDTVARLDDFDPEFRMLQAFLHVSGIPKKAWLLPLMRTLADSVTRDYAKAILSQMELQLRKDQLVKKNLHCGLKTSHYALFALDYELWRKYNNSGKQEVAVEGRKYQPRTDFVFRFRDSVEHVYPQNPVATQHWNLSLLDGFGNLTLIAQSSNAAYSNQLPENKRRDFAKDAEIESMKLLEIYSDDEFTKWLENKGSDHGNQMIQVLIDSFPVEPAFSEVRTALKAQLRS